MANDLEQATARAMKWSSLTEILAKFISPLINMILARILAPEAFGVLATVTMVISFGEIFVDSGFQKFLVQHEFQSADEEKRYMSVAFWANLVFSLLIWGLLIVFCKPIAYLASGDSGEKGYLIAIAGITIPLHGVIGIQNCNLKKKLEFKQLFFVRIVAALVPLFITLPLALLGLDYWSILIGNIAGAVIRSFMLVLVSKFVPSWYFNFRELKYMLSFGVWTFLDGIAVWATNWIDSLLIAHLMSDYHLGLYKNSLSTITALFTMVTSALTPVLFSALSRLQDDKIKFNSMFLSVQKSLCTILLPLSVGIFLYSNLATDILFGNSWAEAADIIGIMSLMTGLRTIFVSIYSNAYHARGKFYIPLMLQIIDLIVLVPACIISANFGFWPLVYTRAFIKLDLIIPEIIVVFLLCGITPKETAKNLLPSIISTVVMSIVALLLQQISNALWWSIISIMLCIIVYFVTLFLFKTERETFLTPIIKKIKR